MSEMIIKKCPFCKGQSEVKHDRECWGHGDYVDKTYVRCSSCGACGGTVYDREIPNKDMRTIAAVQKWNTRKPVEDVLERLEGLKGKDYFSSEDFDGTKHFYFYEETEEHDEMIDYAIEIIKEGLME